VEEIRQDHADSVKRLQAEVEVAAAGFQKTLDAKIVEIANAAQARVAAAELAVRLAQREADARIADFIARATPAAV
jgi:hypothetical protein